MTVAATAQQEADENLGIRLGFAIANDRYLLDTLRRLPAASVPEPWLKWREIAIRKLRHSIFVAEQDVYMATEKARIAARRPRKSATRGATTEWLANFKRLFVEKNGKERGWKKAAALEAGVSPDVITRLARQIDR